MTTDVPSRTTDPAITTDTPRSVGALAATLRGEWIKATTVRANRILLGVAVALGLVTSWATAAFGTGSGFSATDVMFLPTLLMAVLAAIAGVTVFTAEVQHGTLAAALAAHPSRWPVVVAKASIATGLGLCLGVVGLVAGGVGGLVGGLGTDALSASTSRIAWVLLYTVGSALLGLGVGLVVRHGAGAVSGILVWWLVVEGLVVQFAPPELVRFVPFDTGFRTLGIESDLDAPEVLAAGLTTPLHAAIFWSYVLTALAIGTWSVRRRDLDGR
jgi:hypothetical protein